MNIIESLYSSVVDNSLIKTCERFEPDVQFETVVVTET